VSPENRARRSAVFAHMRPSEETDVAARSKNTTVVIVGVGPTGAMLAIELARRGIEVSILDKQPARSSEFRAIGIHARTLEDPVRIHFSGIDSLYPFMLTLSQAETHESSNSFSIAVTSDPTSVHVPKRDEDSASAPAGGARVSVPRGTCHRDWVAHTAASIAWTT